MNIKMRHLALIAAGMLMAASPTVSDEAPSVLAGPGGFSCGKIIADTKNNETVRDAYFFWAQGFLSGLNFKYFLNSFESATNLADYKALRHWLENYCDENPLDMYGVAAAKLWNELRLRQGLEPDLRFPPKE